MLGRIDSSTCISVRDAASFEHLLDGDLPVLSLPALPAFAAHWPHASALNAGTEVLPATYIETGTSRIRNALVHGL
jgi:hypothetical protein